MSIVHDFLVFGFSFNFYFAYKPCFGPAPLINVLHAKIITSVDYEIGVQWNTSRRLWRASRQGLGT
jgi:hypothetical protein